ncbi:MAG: MFS transporter [Bacteroidetes bacterium]|nr:MFS transporter [Bacteroidota bacterium]
MNQTKELHPVKSIFNASVIVAALGYFVDIYDLILFSIVRRPSLEELGVVGASLKDTGLYLLNVQMIGMLIGGIIWGILGDKRGRISVLFGSIILYSLANIANGLVHDVQWYAIVRFIAGVGLAGELGAGITLVSETVHKKNRGYGTMIVVVFGALGAVLAAFVGDMMGWRNAYFVGGGLGIALLITRAKAFESGMFHGLKNAAVKRGSFLHLFSDWHRFRKYLACISVGFPVWFTVGILITLAPEFAEKCIGVSGKIVTGKAVMFSYLGLSFGDLISGILSQILKSRKKVVIIFVLLNLTAVLFYIFARDISVPYFYFLCFCLGAATGYWALFVTIASEQFGTNIRATVTTTVPNFVRGAVVPITFAFQFFLKDMGYTYTISALIIGSVCVAVSLLATSSLKETFGKDLDYLEVH